LVGWRWVLVDWWIDELVDVQERIGFGRASMATYICWNTPSWIQTDKVLVLGNVITVCFLLLRVMLHVITAIKRRDDGVDRTSLGLD